MINNDFFDITEKMVIRLLIIQNAPISITIKKTTLHDSKQTLLWPQTHSKKSGYGGWDWETLWGRYKYKLCISIKVNDKVGALFCGKVKNNFIEIEYIQRNYNCLELKGFASQVAILYSTTLATVLGKKLIRISNPAPKIVHYYQSILGSKVISKINNKSECIYLEALVTDIFIHLSLTDHLDPGFINNGSILPEIISGSSSI